MLKRFLEGYPHLSCQASSVNILLTIEFSVFTIEASDQQYTGGGAICTKCKENMVSRRLSKPAISLLVSAACVAVLSMISILVADYGFAFAIY